MTSGPKPPNPAELLGSNKMTEFLTSATRKLDLVIVDAPPILPVTDSQLLANKVDGTVLVVRQGVAQKAAVRVLRSTGVSKDAKISPIFHYLSLDKTPTIWVDKAIEISKDKLAHTNMQSYVIESGYNVNDTARWLQQYYLDKYQLAKK